MRDNGITLHRGSGDGFSSSCSKTRQREREVRRAQELRRLTKVVGDKVEVFGLAVDVNLVPFGSLRVTSVPELLTLSRPEDCDLVVRLRLASSEQVSDRSSVV